MSETDFRHQFRDQMSPFGQVQAIESPIESGIPDLCVSLRFPNWPIDRAVTTWIELKFAREWPKLAKTKLKFKHYTKEQKLWLLGWHAEGGNCCLIAKVASEYFLVPPAHLRELQEEGMTRQRFVETSAVHSHMFPRSAFLKWLVKWKS